MKAETRYEERSREDAAKYLHVTKHQIDRWTGTGLLTPIRYDSSHKAVYSVEDLRRVRRLLYLHEKLNKS